jgi:2',3'-cyclic-nucleotide 2'-phosphodiesterase (5'-nucleotidase family)
MAAASALAVALLLAPPAASRPVTITVVGTNDLHGGIAPREGRGGLALFAGYVANVRRARAEDGGAVVLVDAGDMFQGSLESNLAEGAPVVEAYNALGYDAAAIGNHDFDYGPVGPASVPRSPADDPFGALEARAAEARFPFLAANILVAATGQPVAWPNVKPTAIVEKAGVKVGIVGVSTEVTLRTTMAANVATLAMAPLAETIAARAAELRKQGAEIVVVAAHAGGDCRDYKDPDDLSSCAQGQEIVAVANALPRGLVDAIVAGHRHEGMAHRVNGIAIGEAFTGGRSFSRVDLTFDRAARRVTLARPLPPQSIVAGSYEGAPVVADAAIGALLAPATERARKVRDERLGPVLDGVFAATYETESALGNLLADLMLESRPQAQVALVNGGGLRADLPAGELTYGALYDAQPFDNRLALVAMTGTQLAAAIAESLGGSGGILSLAGTSARARCDGAALAVSTRFGADEKVLVVTNEFLATGMLARLSQKVTLEDGTSVRDEAAALLRKRRGRLRPQDFYDPARPRLVYDGQRPLRCEAAAAGTAGRSARRRAGR